MKLKIPSILQGRKLNYLSFLLGYEILFHYYQLQTQYSDFRLHQKHL